MHSSPIDSAPILTGESLDTLLEYWFGSDPKDPERLASRKRMWFSAGPGVDREIASRFGALHAAAARGELEAWYSSARGRLAAILLFDQLPRNLFRGQGEAFAHDAEALGLARAGIRLSQDRELDLLERMFFYMPFQHAEALAVQQRSVDLFESLAAEPAPAELRQILASAADSAHQHRDIVARFGRFPHRNRLLGRSSTEDERSYLSAGGPSFGQ